MKAQLVHSRKMTLGQKIGWTFLLLLAIYPVLISLGYLTFNPENFAFEEQRAVYMAHMAMLMIHIIASMLAILIGPFPCPIFCPNIRESP